MAAPSPLSARFRLFSMTRFHYQPHPPRRRPFGGGGLPLPAAAAAAPLKAMKIKGSQKVMKQRKVMKIDGRVALSGVRKTRSERKHDARGKQERNKEELREKRKETEHERGERNRNEPRKETQTTADAPETHTRDEPESSLRTIYSCSLARAGKKGRHAAPQQPFVKTVPMPTREHHF